MSVVEPGPQTQKLVERVKAILLQPEKTWEVIDSEPATIGDLYKAYVIPLALIPSVCGLIGSFFGIGAFGFHYRPSIPWAISSAVLSFAGSLVGVYVMALIVDGLAPSFGGTKNQIQAFKVAAYSWTAAWVAGVFEILPAISWLSILGLYSFYLLYKGLPRLMKAPADKATSYTVVAVICAIVINAVIMGIAGSVVSLGRSPFGGHGMVERDLGTITGPNGAQVDLGKLEAASKKMEAAAKRAQSGELKPVDAEVLKAMLPAAAAGFTRGEVSTSSSSVGDLGGATAEGVYTRGGAKLTLSVTDIGAAGALSSLAGAFNVQSSEEKDGRVEKVGKVDGRMTMESYDKAAQHGEYSVLVGDRFMVKAEGDGVGAGDLKTAVAALGLPQLEKLAAAN